MLELSRAQGATFYMSMLAAFATLLYRRTGQDDIVIGSPIANRNNLELQGLIGFVSNTVALRIRLAGEPELPRGARPHARDRARAPTPTRICPSTRSWRSRRPSATRATTRCFRSTSAPRPPSGRDCNSAVWSTEPIPVDIGFARFDLALELELRRDELAGYFEYDQDLFAASTIDGFVEDLLAILEQVTADPDAPVLEAKLARHRASRSAGGTIARRAR